MKRIKTNIKPWRPELMKVVLWRHRTSDFRMALWEGPDFYYLSCGLVLARSQDLSHSTMYFVENWRNLFHFLGRAFEAN